MSAGFDWPSEFSASIQNGNHVDLPHDVSVALIVTFSNIESAEIKYQTMHSAVDAEFWKILADRKLNVEGLKSEAVPILACLPIIQNHNMPHLLHLGSYSFQDQPSRCDFYID